MHRFIPAVLSTLVISIASPSAVTAQSVTVDSSAFNPVAATRASGELTPFDLAFLAYRGYLKDEDIPSGQLLITELEAGNVSAKTIVQGAIKAHRLSEQTLNDDGYLHALERQLEGFSED